MTMVSDNEIHAYGSLRSLVWQRGHRINERGRSHGRCGFVVASEWKSGEGRWWCGRLSSVFRRGRVDAGMDIAFYDARLGWRYGILSHHTCHPNHPIPFLNPTTPTPRRVATTHVPLDRRHAVASTLRLLPFMMVNDRGISAAGHGFLRQCDGGGRL